MSCEQPFSADVCHLWFFVTTFTAPWNALSAPSQGPQLCHMLAGFVRSLNCRERTSSCIFHVFTSGATWRALPGSDSSSGQSLAPLDHSWSSFYILMQMEILWLPPSRSREGFRLSSFTSWSHGWEQSCPQGTFPRVSVQNGELLFNGDALTIAVSFSAHGIAATISSHVFFFSSSNYRSVVSFFPLHPVAMFPCRLPREVITMPQTQCYEILKFSSPKKVVCFFSNSASCKFQDQDQNAGSLLHYVHYHTLGL